jgi:hypothetical protein
MVDYLIASQAALGSAPRGSIPRGTTLGAAGSVRRVCCCILGDDPTAHFAVIYGGESPKKSTDFRSTEAQYCVVS